MTQPILENTIQIPLQRMAANKAEANRTPHPRRYRLLKNRLKPLLLRSVDQTTHKSTTVTKATKAKTTVIIQTKAVKSKSYKGKNATRIPIITYHRVISDKEKKKIKGKNSSLFISVSMFRKQMRWLHKHNYRTISTQEFYDWYTGKIKLPKKSVLITFDDGSYSVMKYALPVLKKYNMKATFFIIGKNTFWA